MIFLLFFGCSNEGKLTTPSSSFTQDEREIIFRMSPLETPEPDQTNSYANIPKAIEFGEILFDETALSVTGDISCSSCHDPAKGWSDGLDVAEGIEKTSRHASSLWGVGHQRWLFWDGRCDTLWCQALSPMEADHEMGSSRVAIARAIAEDDFLKQFYEDIFGELPSMDTWPTDAKPIDDNVDDPRHIAWNQMSEEDRSHATSIFVHIAKAIAAFEATILPPSTAIDDFVSAFHQDEEEALMMLSVEQEKGLRLFIGKGQCHLCHSGALFTNLEFHNIGLGHLSWLDEQDNGRYNGVSKLQANPFNSTGIWSDAPEGDRAQRLHRIAQTTELLGQFKTPTLRQLTTSSPYMHGGHFTDLQQVITHYSDAEGIPLYGHREELLQPQNWSVEEIEALVSFLEMLSSEP